MSDPTTFNGCLRVTRITNACVLLEIGGHVILTDPWFRNPWGFTEDPGLSVTDLPRLTAVLGSHAAPDHWDMRALRGYAHCADTPVFTATASMARRAEKAGFARAECIDWGQTRALTPDLTLEVVEAQRTFGMRSNNYVLATSSVRVFFGGETRRLEPLRAYRQKHPAVDVVLAPVNGMQLLGWRLVTTAAEALAGARILGAHTLVPIHDSMHFLGFGGPTSSTRELPSDTGGNPEIVVAKAGVRTVLAVPQSMRRNLRGRQRSHF